MKKGIESSWNISQDGAMLTLVITFAEQPMAMNMQFQHQYAEPYEWIVRQFKDWAFTLTSSFLFYHDYDQLDEASKNTYHMGMAAFVGIAPTYHIALFDKPARCSPKRKNQHNVYKHREKIRIQNVIHNWSNALHWKKGDAFGNSKLAKASFWSIWNVTLKGAAALADGIPLSLLSKALLCASSAWPLLKYSVVFIWLCHTQKAHKT